MNGRKLNWFVSISGRLNEITGRLFSWIVILIVFITVLDVMLRYIFSQPLQWAFDAVKQLYAIEFLLLAGYGLLHNQHVAVDVFTSRLSEKKMAALELLSYSIFFIPFAIMLIVYGYEFAKRSFLMKETTWGAIATPVYPLKIIMVLSFILLLLAGVSKIITIMATLFSKEGVE